MNHSTASEKKHRLQYIDVLETFAIICVCMCHHIASMGESVASNLILQIVTIVAVPLFFMCNGTLLLQAKLDVRRHYKKTAFLALSIIAWKTLYLVGMYVLIYRKEPLPNAMAIVSYFLGENINTPYVPADHFWYLYALLGIYLIFPCVHALYHMSGKIGYYILLGILFLFGLLIPDLRAFLNDITSGNIENSGLFDALVASTDPFSYRTGSFLFYFALGPVLHEMFYNKPVKRLTGLLLVFGIMIGYMILLLDRFVEYGTLAGAWCRLDADYRRIGLLMAVSCIYAIVASIPFRANAFMKICEFLSVRTMGIYATHNAIAYLLSLINDRVLHLYNIPFHMAKTVFVLLLSIGAAELLALIPGVRTVLRLEWRKRR